MKKILFILLVLISSIASAQYNFFTPQGATNNQWYNKGSYGVDGGFVFRTNFIDSATLNSQLYIPGTAGIMVRTVDLLRYRSNSANRWLTLLNNENIGTFGWSLLGNSGTTAGTNFVGTTDSVGLMFRLNGQVGGFLDINRKNTSFGQRSLAGIGVSGLNNVAIGYTALESLTLGDENVAVGYGAIRQLTGTSISTGRNIGVGARSLDSLTSGTGNVAIGYLTLGSLKTSSFDIAIGYNAASKITSTSGGEQIAIGSSAMQNAVGVTGYNIAIGTQSLSASGASTNIGQSNIAIGYSTLAFSTSSYNTVVGHIGLSTNSTGTLNTGMGYQVLRDNTTGYANSAFGANAGLTNTTGFQNTFIGSGSGEANTTGQENTFVGYDAGLNNVTGLRNTYVGWNAKGSAAGIHNTSIGYSAGRGVTDSAANNTFLGESAGYHVSQKIDADNTIALGADSYTSRNHQFSVSDSIHSFTFHSISRGVANYVLTDSTGDGEYWVARPISSIGIPISSLTAATGNNDIDNGNTTQILRWGTLGNNPDAFSLVTNSTAAAGNNQTLFRVLMSGANSNSTQTTKAATFSNGHTGTSSTNYGVQINASNGESNIAALITASGGTNNYAIVVPSSGGNVGIGTSTPASILHVVGSPRIVDGLQANGKTFTSDADGVGSWKYDTATLATFGAGAMLPGDTAAFTDSTLYGSFYNDGNDTLVITAMRIVMQGTNDTLDINIEWNDSINVAGTKLKTAYAPANNNYTGNNYTSFDNSKIAPGNWVWCKSPYVLPGRRPSYLSVTLIGYKKRV